MINVNELEEFQYMFGDPRLQFHDYLLTLPNMTCYTKTKERQFVCLCNKEQKRVLEPPSERALKDLETNISQGTNPITVVPVLLRGKFQCKFKDKGRHSNVILYNRKTHEVERIDIKRYHIDGYKIKLFIDRLETVFMEKIVSVQDPNPNLTLVIDIDVPLAFMQKHGYDKARDAYPIFTLAYVNMRSKFPNLASQNVIAKVIKLSEKQLETIWTTYKSFKAFAKKPKCNEGFIENPESGRCLRPLSPSFQKLLIEKPVKDCKGGRVYSTLLEKCVPANKNHDVDILMSQILPHSKNVNSTQLIHVDKKQLEFMTFIMKQFPHAYFIYPRGTQAKKLDFTIRWKYSEDKKEFQLTMPNDYWSMWEHPLTTPSVRFIIAYITLISNLGGVHANVYIYDKNTNEMERFDSLGRSISDTYHIESFDEVMKPILERQVGKLFTKPVKYLTPMEFCPNFRIFQTKETDDIPGKDRRGNCAVWRAWYIHMRLSNPHLKRKELVLLAVKKLQSTGSPYKFIKAYHAYIMNLK